MPALDDSQISTETQAAQIAGLNRRALLKMGGAALGSLALADALGMSGPHDADAIVVGAGASGCSVAWHLRQKGLSVHVLEAAEGPATQASRNAAGFVAHWSAVHIPAWGETEWQMQHYGIGFYRDRAQSATFAGIESGFVPSGIAYIYRSTEQLRKVMPRIEAARQLGTRLEMLTAARCREVLPQIDFAQVAGIAYDPDSVRIRAADMIPAVAREAALRGVRFSYNEPVLELIAGGVRTAKASYRASAVVVTAGAWTRPLLERSGKRCPAEPVAEIRYTTRPLPGITPDMPLLIFADYGFYIREERGGLLIGGGDPEPPPPDRHIDPSNPPKAAELKVDQAYRVRRHIRVIEDVMPALRQAEIDTIAGGIPTFTGDLHFIADAVPGMHGSYALTACQEAGITHGPGLGRMLAELITTGSTTWNRDPYRLTRFESAASQG